MSDDELHLALYSSEFRQSAGVSDINSDLAQEGHENTDFAGVVRSYGMSTSALNEVYTELGSSDEALGLAIASAGRYARGTSER